ncbi:UNVERIFIED_CONTAM: hypothetical protein GTU68_024021, partial [Idotea baltica]|nr:hypothetical protein [Idotea baltica]
MLRQQFRFRQQLKRLQADKPTAEQAQSHAAKIAELATRIAESKQLRDERAKRVPKIQVDQDLPIFQRQTEIIEAIQNNQVVVISGETGSGKSTQLPLMAMLAGYGISGTIGHTQPRRIAARGVASRIAQQFKSTVGKEVGFKIRFDDKTSQHSYVKLMTDGILLAE